MGSVTNPYTLSFNAAYGADETFSTQLKTSCPKHSAVSKTWKCPDAQTQARVLFSHAYIDDVPNKGDQKVKLKKDINREENEKVRMKVLQAYDILASKGLVLPYTK